MGKLESSMRPAAFIATCLVFTACGGLRGETSGKEVGGNKPWVSPQVAEHDVRVMPQPPTVKLTVSINHGPPIPVTAPGPLPLSSTDVVDFIGVADESSTGPGLQDVVLHAQYFAGCEDDKEAVASVSNVATSYCYNLPFPPAFSSGPVAFGHPCNPPAFNHAEVAYHLDIGQFLRSHCRGGGYQPKWSIQGGVSVEGRSLSGLYAVSPIASIDNP